MLFVGNVHYIDWLIFLFPHNTNFLQGSLHLQTWKEDVLLCLQYFRILYNIFLSLNIDTHKLLFEDVRVKDHLKQIEFMGIPFIIMDKKKFDCTHGVDRNRSLKKKRLDEKVEKVYIYIYIYIDR